MPMISIHILHEGKRPRPGTAGGRDRWRSRHVDLREGRMAVGVCCSTDIKVLYCFHQNNDDSKCEVAHTSLRLFPHKNPTTWKPGGDTWHQNSGLFLQWR